MGRQPSLNAVNLKGRFWHIVEATSDIRRDGLQLRSGRLRAK
jgi:hypothetical protein